jgi:hypothetical protein
MVWTKRSGPELKAALMRFMPEMSVTSPGMSTHRSRGIDRMVTVLAAGSMRTAMVTSLRWPPWAASEPNAFTWVGLSTNARESDPTSNMVNGC